MNPVDLQSLLSLLPLLPLLPVGSFVAGLTATPHCAVMCGPLFVLFGAGGPAYQIGRVLGYTATGAVAGALGASLNFAGDFAAVQHLSLYFMAVTLILFGLYRLLPTRTRAKYFPDFSALTRWLVGRMNRLTAAGLAQTNSMQHQAAPNQQRQARPDRAASVSFFAGTLSALLPCGPLIPLWLLAAGSGEAFSGASLAGGFVLGTLPGAALVTWSGRRMGDASPASVTRSSSAWAWVWIAGARRFAGVALLVAGLAMLGTRFAVVSPGSGSQDADAAGPICHTPETLFL